MQSEEEYYEALEDFEEIQEYLVLDPVDFDVPFVPPPFIPDYSSAVIIDNLPKTTEDKLPKLTAVLIKLVKQLCPNLLETDLTIPLDNASPPGTYGFCFIKLKDSKEAENVIKVLNGYKLGSNIFNVTVYSDLDKFNNISEVYVPKQLPQFAPRPDPTSWLCDSKSRDQYVIRHGLETEISWANLVPGEDPLLVYDGSREKAGGKNWTESTVQWSPQGTYLATFHPKGIKLWGGEDFQAHGKFMHDGVTELEFSPCENYLITYNFNHKNIEEASDVIMIWDVYTGTLLNNKALKYIDPRSENYQVRATVPEIKKKNDKDDNKLRVEKVILGRIESYVCEKNRKAYFKLTEGNNVYDDIPSDKVVPLQDPNRLKWSYDGKYVARLGCDLISIFTMPNMQLLDKKSLPAPGVVDFCWSPNSNVISYYSPANGNHPALINIISIPTREEVCSRKLFDVTDGKMIWQNDGDYLCVTMIKTQGKKRTNVCMFFRVCDVGVPVEQIELNETIATASWEASGDRIAIAHGESRSLSISFYTMNINNSLTNSRDNKTATTAKGKKEITLLHTLNGIPCSELLWSPAGNVIAIAQYSGDACTFELHDVENNSKLATRRHDRSNKLVWDPSGRMLASCTITNITQRSIRGQPDDGFNLYSFQGTPIAQVKREKLFVFQWRSRPKNLLSSDEKKKVIKNLKKYEKLFDKEDRVRRQQIYQELVLLRRKTAQEFYNIVNKSKANLAQLKKMRCALRNGYDSDDDKNYIVETVVDETVVSNKEIIIQQ